MISRLSAVLIFMVFYQPLLNADEEVIEDLPFIEFIQFLGEWETEDGEWIDPNEFESEGFVKAYTELDTRNTDRNESSDNTAKSEQE